MQPITCCVLLNCSFDDPNRSWELLRDGCGQRGTHVVGELKCPTMTSDPQTQEAATQTPTDLSISATTNGTVAFTWVSGPSDTPPSNSEKGNGDDLNTGEIIGIALGVFAGSAIALGPYYAFKTYKRSSRRAESRHHKPSPKGHSYQVWVVLVEWGPLVLVRNHDTTLPQ